MMSFLEGLTAAQTESIDLTALLLDSGVSVSHISAIMKKINSIVVANVTDASNAQIAKLQKQVKDLKVELALIQDSSKIAALQRKISNLEVLQ